MNDLIPMTVAPLTPPDTDPAEYTWRKDIELNGCLGFIIWLVVCIVGYVLIFNLDTPDITPSNWRLVLWPLYYLSPIIAGLLALHAVLLYLEEISITRNAARKIIAVEEHRREVRERSEDEARELSQRLAGMIDEAGRSKQRFVRQLAATCDEIRMARVELNRNASVFFWERYEGAIDSFWNSLQVVEEMRGTATSYYASLEHRAHTFDRYPIEVGDLTQCRDVESELVNLRRAGIERGGDFVVVWESRRTREVIIGVFKSLEDAVGRIGSEMDKSMQRFEVSVSDNVAQRVIASIRGREQK